MQIREFRPSDMVAVKDIYARYYSGNEYPDFSKGFNIAFVIVDDNNNIINVAGIKQTVELISVTDKCFSPAIRKEALQIVMSAVRYAQEKFNIKEILAFVHDDDKWIRRLVKSGFELTDNKVLTLSLRG